VRRLVAIGIVAASLALSSAAPAFAATPPAIGQPNVDCPATITSPAGFNTAGFANAASVYANPGATAENMSGNTAAEAQYDVACFASAH
jgi:hypothetical protein